MARLCICVSSIAPGVIWRPPRLMRHDGPGTQDRQRSKQCRTGCSYREATVAGEHLSPPRLMATAKELCNLFIPSKAIEFPGVLDFIKGKQPAQAGIFALLDIDEAEEGICCYFTTDQRKANTFSESVRQQMALLRRLSDQSLQFVLRERPIGFHHGHDTIHIADNNPRQHLFCQFLGLLHIPQCRSVRQAQHGEEENTREAHIPSCHSNSLRVCPALLPEQGNKAAGDRARLRVIISVAGDNQEFLTRYTPYRNGHTATFGQ